ncbi:GNAT family N-acetyltransferase [Ochrobactrum quorumnocens]|jgi:ribosomal protein S18 acetylase RimI-like enzyme|uniref:Acetyltransferase domain protein n=1 Tax=Ochrobactrum quorumnocens TaxID=271865 RepID=A0A248UIK6_9HYPH|nr:GNAT family N-acetyltransferase [[Ochrobactrum] quorumnocens]ASV86514.1 acetyltransferase domain protein [[Ochrobactrum] quorumnocens]KAA9366661.1 GNAT family N-acetyltransferase [[Ochrobactrum] quorumnocens]MBD7992552.1 GNAT family N-acetyltransferase [Ochrobactrum gallinarum]
MKNMSVTIRAYEAADKETLSSIWYRASLEAHAFLGSDLLRDQQKLIEDVYLEKAETWVAIIDNKPVGFIGLLGSFIGGLFVNPAAQGHGIGRRLIAYALAMKGELSLEVYVNNERAYRFYKQLGFQEISRRAEDDNGFPFANIEMQLKD